MDNPFNRDTRSLVTRLAKTLSEAVVENRAATQTPLKSRQAALNAAAVELYTTPPESIAEAVKRDPDLWRILQEALNRGAQEEVLVTLLFRYRRRRWPAPNEVPQIEYLRESEDIQIISSPDVRSLEEEEDLKIGLEVIRLAIIDYRRKMRVEFDTLERDDSSIKGAFNFGEGLDAFEHYLARRSMYYRAGYKDPTKDIFVHIKTGASVMGHKVGGGLHKDFVVALDRLTEHLGEGGEASLRLFAQIKEEIREVYGFVPRTIANTDKMSNHARGFAIDVNAPWNPHIVNHEEVVALNWVVKEIGFDFGKKFDELVRISHVVTFWQFVEKNPAFELSEVTRVRILHEKSRRASDKVRSWLNDHLVSYRYLKSEIDKAQDLLKKTDPNSEEHRRAQETLELAQRQIAEDENLSRLQILDRNRGADIEEWAKQGIQTLPLEFVVAMKKTGFKWGGEYDHSKDFMHFELLTTEPEPLPEGFGDLFGEHEEVIIPLKKLKQRRNK